MHLSYKGVLACFAALVAMAVSGCGSDSASFARANNDAHDDQLRSTSVPVAVELSVTNGTNITVTTTEDELTSATLVFATGEAETWELSGVTGTVSSAVAGKLSYVRIETCGRDYWYFDDSGRWLPDGYVPSIGTALSSEQAETDKGASMVVLTDDLLVVSSDLYVEVKVAYSDSTVDAYATAETTGTYPVTDPETVEAIRVTLAADGSKWYFDENGNLLPLDSRWYQDMD